MAKKFKFSKPSLEHLCRLTDDTGILQHGKSIIPDRQSGYCTDDNARGLIVVTKYLESYGDPPSKKLFDTYLAFLYHALKPDKTVQNFLDYDRKWRPAKSEDALGRAIWAFGTVLAAPPIENYIPMVREFYCDSSKHIPSLSLRGQAYAMLGLIEFLKKYPKNNQSTELLSNAADTFVDNYDKNSSADWRWFEDILTYATAVMPTAMYGAAKILGSRKYLDVAEKTCSFLLEHTYNGKHFSFIGSNGWYPKGKKKAQFDQQAIEAADTVLMLANAYWATKNKKYVALQKKAFGWFLGENDIHKPLYDRQTGGCCDGLGADGININQGAESVLSFLLAQLSLI